MHENSQIMSTFNIQHATWQSIYDVGRGLLANQGHQTRTLTINNDFRYGESFQV